MSCCLKLFFFVWGGGGGGGGQQIALTTFEEAYRESRWLSLSFGPMASRFSQPDRTHLSERVFRVHAPFSPMASRFSQPDRTHLSERVFRVHAPFSPMASRFSQPDRTHLSERVFRVPPSVQWPPDSPSLTELISQNVCSGCPLQSNGLKILPA